MSPLVSEDDGEGLVDALNRDGMLSPVLEDWRAEYLDRYQAFFAYGRALNRSAMQLWLAYLAASPEAALRDLEADDLKSFIERERELQRVYASQPDIAADARVREAGYVAKLGSGKRRPIAAIAKAHGSPNAYLQYRILSGTYGHLSQTSLRHNFLRREDGSGLNVLGPHADEIPSALYFSCIALIDGCAAYAAIVGGPRRRAGLPRPASGGRSARPGGPRRGLSDPGHLRPTRSGRHQRSPHPPRRHRVPWRVTGGRDTYSAVVARWPGGEPRRPERYVEGRDRRQARQRL